MRLRRRVDVERGRAVGRPVEAVRDRDAREGRREAAVGLDAVERARARASRRRPSCRTRSGPADRSRRRSCGCPGSVDDLAQRRSPARARRAGRRRSRVATTRPPAARGRTIAATGPGMSIDRVVPRASDVASTRPASMSTQASSPRAREPARPLAVMRQGLGDLLGVHDSSLPAVDGERTVLLRSGEVKVRLRRSARARRVRLVLAAGGRPRARRAGARVARRDRRGARDSSRPWLERALARQRPGALGLARPGVAWHGGEPVALRVVDREADERRLERRRARAARARPPRPRPRRSSAGTASRRARRSPRRSSARPTGLGVAPHVARRARSAHALGLVLVARHALVLVAPAARAVAGCSTTSSATSSATCASRNHSQHVLVALREASPGGRLAPLAARARRRACDLPAGG